MKKVREARMEIQLIIGGTARLTELFISMTNVLNGCDHFIFYYPSALRE